MREAPRLGRGLASLLGDALGSPLAGTAGSTGIDLLEPNPFQPRSPIDDADLSELADSIREQGLLQPILIRRHPEVLGRFQIIAGERRWRAARLAGLTSIPSYIRDMPDEAANAAALVENLQRQDLNPIEEAEGYRRLSDGYGLTQDDLAKAIGKSRSHVANLLRLLQLPLEVIQHVREGTLTAGHARAALACSNPGEAAQMMIVRGLNVRQAEALSKPTPGRESHRTSEHNKSAGSADLRAMEADLSEHLGLKVSLSFKGRGGRISLDFQTLDQLDHIASRLRR